MRKHRLRGVAIVLALALSGCWLQAGGGPANTPFNAAESSLTRANVASLAEIVASAPWTPSSPSRSCRATASTWPRGSTQDGGSLLDVLGVQAYDRGTVRSCGSSRCSPPAVVPRVGGEC